MNDREVGDYEWRQLSIWDFAPDDCIETYVKSGDLILHFYLRKITEIFSENHYKTAVVSPNEEVPEEILSFRGGQVLRRCDGKRIP